jgi:predicted nucleic acid-binding protein
MNYLLDTNVISELVAKRPSENVTRWMLSIGEEDLFLSVITLGEIQKGIEKLPDSARKADLANWLNTDLLSRFKNRLVVIDAAVMLEWGRLTAQLELAGKPMSAIDALLAASARLGDRVLVTRNPADFEHANVQTLNPWQSGG